MTHSSPMKFGVFLAPFHELGDNPTLALERDLELLEWLDSLGFDEAWVGEHHSSGWETIASPEIFIAAAAERTKHINLGTGVISLPYHHPLMVANRMVLLDHLTRGRVMMGVGPGALVTDAYMLGIDPSLLRARMDESLGIIIRLLTETAPITYQSNWFILKEALIHLRPYTQPCFPIAVSAAQSPSGMISAGKHGTGVLSFAPMREGVASTLKEFWGIAQETADKYGTTMDRDKWRLVLPVFLADSPKEAVKFARAGAGRYQHKYFEQTMGQNQVIDGPPGKIIDFMVNNGRWCVGSPDDLINTIQEFQDESGGFGGLLIQATEWGTRDQVLHSFELIARYVMPHFQGSLVNLRRSQEWASAKAPELTALRTKAIEEAETRYLGRK